MKNILLILIILSLIIMTTLIVIGIVRVLRNNNGKGYLIAGMVTGAIPVILATVFFFLHLKGFI